MDEQAVLDYLYQHLPMYQKVGAAAYKKDLGNITKLCEALGNPHARFKAIHIAGTNGKGSCAHALSAILQSAGYRTGLYTSPHLKRFTERIKVDGQEVPMAYVGDFVARHKPLIESAQPSFFEVTVAMAFAYFAQSAVDVAVVETGLGGRLDSTNILVPEVCLVTNISYDHQQFLGDTLPLIAAEKAGIFKPGVPAVVGERQAEVAEVFGHTAKAVGAPLYFAQDYYKAVPGNGKVDFRRLGQPWLQGVQPEGYGAAYQLKNYPGVLMALELLAEKGLGVDKAAIRDGLARLVALTGLKGRWQIMGQAPKVVCDTAHNQAGVAQAMQQLAGLRQARQTLHVVWGMAKDKTLGKILPLLPNDAKYYFCQPEGERCRAADDLVRQAEPYGLAGKAYPSVNQALAKAKQEAGPDGLVYVGGSVFVVAEVAGL